MSKIENLEWSIQGLQVAQKNNVSDVIVSAMANIKGFIGNDSASVLCQQDITFDQNGFTPFDQVTESQVVSWIQAAMGQQRIDLLKINIENQIQEIIASRDQPVVFKPVPWAVN